MMIDTEKKMQLRYKYIGIILTLYPSVQLSQIQHTVQAHIVQTHTKTTQKVIQTCELD